MGAMAPPSLDTFSISYLLTLSDYLPWSKAKVRKFLGTYDLSLADWGPIPLCSLFSSENSARLTPWPEGQVLAVADMQITSF